MEALLEERVDSLESVLGHFIVSTSSALSRMERGLDRLSSEMKAFKDEMHADRVNLSSEMKTFKDEMRADRVNLNKEWGKLANKMGTVVEDIVAPNIPRVAREYFQIEKLDYLAIRVRKRHTIHLELVREFDVIAVSETSFIINETKSTPRMDYVIDFINLLKEIPGYFPESAGRKVIPIFSSLYIPEDVVKYLSGGKVYAMAMGDETMEVLNFHQLDL